MDRVATGSIPAFAELYDRYGARAQRIAASTCRDSGRAEDAVQEAFLSLWRNRSRYDERRGSVAAWVLTSVYRRAIDSERRDERHRVHQTSEHHLDDDPAPHDTLGEALRRDDAARVRACLSRLPAVQLEVIVLAYYGQLSHTEIAEHLGIPPGTVKGRMRLALEKLRDSLERHAAHAC